MLLQIFRLFRFTARRKFLGGTPARADWVFEYPEMLINQCHILGEELSDGVVIAKDYADGSSFTEKICRTILQLKESGIPSEKIVDMINDAVTEHLNQVISQTENKSTNKKV